MFEAIRGTLLVSGLVFPGIAAYTAVYLTLATMLAMAPCVRSGHLQSPVALAVFAAFGGLVLSILLNGASAGNWTTLAMALPFIAVPMTGAGLASVTPRQFATFCLLGASAALAVGLIDIFALDLSRAGGENNPIHYASLAGMLGMVSLIGAVGQTDRLRYVFLLGPVAAFATALLSGSRGPLLADGVMFVIAFGVFWRDRRFILALLIFPLVGLAAIVLSGAGQRALLLFSGILSERTMQSDGNRLMMYQAAGHMFTTSPFWGHGFENFMEIAGALYPPIARYDNLHSDISNLVAVGGMLGGIAYIGLVGAPLFALINPLARQNRPLIALALMVSVGNGVLGLTNAIIGLLPQMTLMVLMTGYVLALERRAITVSDKR
ncbi:O-antigen ligase family protein [Pelagibacterium nitratireducens]|uniref:O-antigen ligase family protein n=1 Tax=Pelagibacterium nitratireducens TaxID=1046114 RepID=A0ABZ2I415_9HYPH